MDPKFLPGMECGWSSVSDVGSLRLGELLGLLEKAVPSRNRWPLTLRAFGSGRSECCQIPTLLQPKAAPNTRKELGQEQKEGVPSC